jgi:hypothetical protein
MLFPSPSVSPWRATSSPPSFPVDRLCQPVKSPRFFLFPLSVFFSQCHSTLSHFRMLYHISLHNLILSFQRPHREILVGFWSRQCSKDHESRCLPIQSNSASEHSRIPNSLLPHHPRVPQRTPGYQNLYTLVILEFFGELQVTESSTPPSTQNALGHSRIPYINPLFSNFFLDNLLTFTSSSQEANVHYSRGQPANCPVPRLPG